MKSCPVCHETYSERIDFCFNDGAVLQLLPSALDAPVPRRMTAREAATADRLRTGTTQEIRFDAAPPTPEPMGSAADAPAPKRVPEPEARPAPEPARPAPAPIAPVVAAASPPPLTPQPVFDELPREVRAPAESKVPAWVLWFAGAASLAGAFVVLVTVLSNGRPAPAPAPTPVVEAPPPPAPAPLPEPEPVEAAAAEVAPPPTPAAAPPTKAAGKGTAPAAAPKPVVRRTETAITAPAAPAGPSPWGAPAEAAESVVTVTSDPPGAVVRVDGKLKGKTPLDVKVAYGRHEVTLQLEGYTLVDRSVDVRSPTLKLPNQLEAASREGSVEVVVPEDWIGATLVVDGRPRGKVPTTLKLAEGAHRFEVRRGDFRAVDQRIVRFDASGAAKLVLDPR